MHALIFIAALASWPADGIQASLHAAAQGVSVFAHQRDCLPADFPPGALPKIPEPPRESGQVFCTAGTAGTADPVPTPPVDPLLVLMQNSVAADAELAAATEAESTSLARKQRASDSAIAAAKAFADEWAKRHPSPTPVPAPVPTGPVTSIVVVSSPATCPPCKLLEPVVNGLKAGGMPITVIDAGSPDAVQWKATAIPTMVMLVNNSEQSRAVGYFDAAAITDWYQRTSQWAKIKFPPPKVSDEVPAPPRR